MLLIVLFGTLPALAAQASCSQGTVEVACPTDPVGPEGGAVSDQFSFAHRALQGDGAITVRLTSMTGTITYPPPNHDQIVSGLVPWAKAGIIVKDGLAQGSQYAALVMTGSHGVRMQYNYVHDTAGAPGGVSAQVPRWLRLTRSGDTLTGEESVDGRQWTRVGTARLPGLPSTVEIGLLATSPSDLTLVRVGAGATVGQARFTQAVGVFDNVTVAGATAGGGWSADAVGEMGQTDWEKFHRAPGLVEADGTLTVTGSGDIGPIGTHGGFTPTTMLFGVAISLIVLIIMAARLGAGRASLKPSIVVGAVTFLAGLAAAAITVPIATALLRANNMIVVPVDTLTTVRVIIGAAALLATATILALALGVLLRRAWVAILAALSVIVVPSLLGVIPFLPEAVSDWLLRLTPAAGFAILQSLREYPQVTAHYAPYAGYYPLPGWAGLTVLCGYTAAALWLAARRKPSLR